MIDAESPLGDSATIKWQSGFMAHAGKLPLLENDLYF